MKGARHHTYTFSGAISGYDAPKQWAKNLLSADVNHK
jgi:hypothetical protein